MPRTTQVFAESLAGRRRDEQVIAAQSGPGRWVVLAAAEPPMKETLHQPRYLAVAEVLVGLAAVICINKSGFGFRRRLWKNECQSTEISDMRSS